MDELIWAVIGVLFGFVVGLLKARGLNHEERKFWMEQGRKVYLARKELEKEKEGLRRQVQESLAE